MNEEDYPTAWEAENGLRGAAYWKNEALECGRILRRMNDTCAEIYKQGARDMAHEIAEHLEQVVTEDKYKHLPGDVLDIRPPSYEE